MPKYLQKILLLNMKEETKAALEVEGYSMSADGFGILYQVPKADRVEPVIVHGYLPTPFTKYGRVLSEHFPTFPKMSAR